MASAGRACVNANIHSVALTVDTNNARRAVITMEYVKEGSVIAMRDGLVHPVPSLYVKDSVAIMAIVPMRGNACVCLVIVVPTVRRGMF